MDQRFTDATMFRDALRVRVPKTIRARASVVYFDAATELHEQIVVETPVKTGYLRAGFLASAPGVEMPTPRERTKADTHAGSFAGEAAAAAAGVGAALAVACGALMPLTMGFVAKYAPYVEDKVHMVKRARRQWASIVRGAVLRAKSDAP